VPFSETCVTRRMTGPTWQRLLLVPNTKLTRVHEFLASPRLVWWIMALAFVLGLPTLDIGLVFDDLAQYMLLRRQHLGQSNAPWWNMFALVEGPREHTIGLRTAGRYPWWVDPDLRVVFFRPLTVATHHLDHWLWPDKFWLMHLHNVLWHTLACGLGWALARRVSSSPLAAGLAALVYAVSFSHVVPVAWLANRNGLVSTTFALASVLAYDAWRRDSSKLGAIASPALLLLALLGAEAGVVTLAFLVAYALFLDDAPWTRRVLSLLPALVLVVAWRAAYDAMDFGAIRSGAYWDPGRDPLRFAADFPLRYLWLLSVSVSPPLVHGFPPLPWLVLTIADAVVVSVFLLRVPSRPARFGVVAAMLGCIPLTASQPGDRLLILTSFGMALAFGELLAAWLLGETIARRRIGAAIVTLVVILIPLIAGPLFASRIDAIRPDDGEVPVYAPQLSDEGLDRKGLVIVHAPNYESVSQLPQTRQARGRVVPNFTWVLHEGPEPPEVRRLDDRTLELWSPNGWPGSYYPFHRSTTQFPFRVGETIKTLDFVATVKQVEAGKATLVQFRFRTRLEHPSFAWVTWMGDEFEPFSPHDRWPQPPE
jgi:hypothetical protein